VELEEIESVCRTRRAGAKVAVTYKKGLEVMGHWIAYCVTTAVINRAQVPRFSRTTLPPYMGCRRLTLFVGGVRDCRGGKIESTCSGFPGDTGINRFRPGP